MKFNMEIEVLASTMNQEDYSIIEKMNIQTGAIIVNQCNINKISNIGYNNNNIKFMSLNERGVGLSRNTALMRASGKVVVFADEDEIFINGYDKVINKEFLKHPKADMIIFNVPSLNPKRKTANIEKEKRIHKYNCMKFGAVNFAVKLDFLKKNNINFSLLFGGGAKYISGEDSLFIIDVLNNKGKVFASKEVIANVEQNDSTWFEGFNEKYFISKGALFYAISKSSYKFLCLQFLIRHSYVFKKVGFWKALHLMEKGAKELKII